MADLSTKDRNELKDSDFGIPSKRKYPIRNTGSEESDRKHVQSAVKLFGHASDDDKPELAYRILQRAKELGMDSSGWEQVNKWAEKYDPKKKSSDVKKESYVPLSEFDHYFQEGTFTTSKNVKKRVETAMDDVILGLNAMHEALSTNKWSKVDFANFWTTHTTFTPAITTDSSGNITGGGQFNTSGKNFKYSLGVLLDYVTLASKRRRTKTAFTESELTTLADYRKDILKYRTLCDSAIRGMRSYDVNLKDVDKATVELLEKSKKIKSIVSNETE